MVEARGRCFLVQSSRSQPQFDLLNGLRAVAFVVSSPLSSNRLHLVSVADFSGAGKYGVYLFSVLSVFLSTRPLVDASSKVHTPPGIGCGMRRVLRIFPLYVIVLRGEQGVSELRSENRGAAPSRTALDPMGVVLAIGGPDGAPSSGPELRISVNFLSYFFATLAQNDLFSPPERRIPVI